MCNQEHIYIHTRKLAGFLLSNGLDCVVLKDKKHLKKSKHFNIYIYKFDMNKKTIYLMNEYVNKEISKLDCICDEELREREDKIC